MRKIKFKVWTGTGMIHPKYNKYPTIGLDLEGNLRYFARKEKDNLEPSYPTFDNGYILLQYTNLKDKNSKEIYEGDIIKTVGIDGYCLWVIEYTDEPSSYVMGFTCEPIGRDISSVHNQVWDEGEIIGNIYQNPELLKEVKNANKKT